MPDGDLLSVAAHDRRSRRSWREVLQIHPAAESIPKISADDFARLTADIAARGLKVPVVILRDGGTDYLIDGRSRLDALEAAGLDVLDAEDRLRANFEVIEAHPKFDPVAYVRSLNVHRRHLKKPQIRKVIEAELKRDPARSDRAIAKDVGVHHTTVTRARDEAESRGDVAKVATRTDSTGRQQPARKPRAEKADPAATLTPDLVAETDRPQPYPASPINEPKLSRQAEPSAPAAVDIFHPIEGHAADLRNLMLYAMGDMPFADWPRLIIRLRDEIDDVERELSGHEARMRADGKSE